MASEASRKKAEELCRKAGCECGGTGAIGRETVRAEHACGGDDGLCQTLCPVPVQDVSYDECERFHDFAAALDAAREDGEKAAVTTAADVFASDVAQAYERGFTVGAERERWECYAAATLAFAQFRGGSPAGVEQRVSEAIAARGPMRGPEEE